MYTLCEYENKGNEDKESEKDCLNVEIDEKI